MSFCSRNHIFLQNNVSVGIGVDFGNRDLKCKWRFLRFIQSQGQKLVMTLTVLCDLSNKNVLVSANDVRSEDGPGPTLQLPRLRGNYLPWLPFCYDHGDGPVYAQLQTLAVGYSDETSEAHQSPSSSWQRLISRREAYPPEDRRSPIGSTPGAGFINN